MASVPHAVRHAQKVKAEKARKGKPPVKGNTKKPALSEAHRKVVDEYFENGCVSQKRALLAAGYAANTAGKMMHTIFGRDDVQAEIARRHRLHEKRALVTEERIMEEYAKLAFANLGDLLEVNEDGTAYMDYNKLTSDQKAAIAEYQVEQYEEKQFDDEGKPSGTVPVKKSRVKFASKQAALDSLARIKGMFKDKVEISGTQSLVEKIQQARQRMHAAKEKQL